MAEINLKNKEEIKIMAEGGKKLAGVKNELQKFVKIGMNAFQVEELATKLIEKSGASPSFKMVPGYSWSTCINVNEGIVHGIPHKEIVFKDKDIVSIDIGIFWKGFHTDTSISFLLGKDKEREKFLAVGKLAFAKALKEARVGNKVKDISAAIEKTLLAGHVNPILDLVGHGVGRELHERPYIPCFVNDMRDEQVVLAEGMVIAIEVMYCLGNPDLLVEKDNWTIRTKDGKISGLFEDTLAIEKKGPRILT